MFKISKYLVVGLFLFLGLFVPVFALGENNVLSQIVIPNDCSGVIISEFISNPVGSDTEGEWIELYNQNDTEANLNGYLISDTEGSGSSRGIFLIENKKLPPNGYLTFYRITTGMTLNNDKESLILTKTNGTSCQTDFASDTQNKEDGYSFAYNFMSKTWSWTTSPTPGSPNVFTVDDSAPNDGGEDDEGFHNSCTGIMITEIMPSPVGSDTENEWIEIYNSNAELVDLGGCVLSDKLKEGSTKKYTIPAGTNIASGKYLKFMRPVTKITLNNDSDGVVLLSSDGVLVSDSGLYTDAGENLSFAYHEGQWYWTFSPTPEADNIITEPPVKIVKKTASTKKKTIAKPPKSTKKTTSKKKSDSSGADVLGANTSDDSSGTGKGKLNDKLMGYILVTLAGVLLVGYVVYINKDFIYENTIKKFRRNS